MYVCNMIENYVEQFSSLIMGRSEEIKFPDVNDFLGEEIDEI